MHSGDLLELPDLRGLVWRVREYSLQQGRAVLELVAPENAEQNQLQLHFRANERVKRLAAPSPAPLQ